MSLPSANGVRKLLASFANRRAGGRGQAEGRLHHLKGPLPADDTWGAGPGRGRGLAGPAPGLRGAVAGGPLRTALGLFCRRRARILRPRMSTLCLRRPPVFSLHPQIVSPRTPLLPVTSTLCPRNRFSLLCTRLMPSQPPMSPLIVFPQPPASLSTFAPAPQRHPADFYAHTHPL